MSAVTVPAGQVAYRRFIRAFKKKQNNELKEAKKALELRVTAEFFIGLSL